MYFSFYSSGVNKVVVMYRDTYVSQAENHYQIFSVLFYTLKPDVDIYSNGHSIVMKNDTGNS